MLLLIDSFILIIFFHAWQTHFVIKILRWLADNLPSIHNYKCLSRWSSKRRRTSSLSGLLTITSTTCTRDVHPGGTLERDVIFFVRKAFTQSVFCARWKSAIKIFLDLIGLVTGFDRSVLIHSFMMFSSHQGFSWNITPTRLSFDTFSFVVIRRLFPLKMTVGRTYQHHQQI